MGLSRFFVYISCGQDLKFINFKKKNLFRFVNLYIDNSEVWEKVTLQTN